MIPLFLLMWFGKGLMYIYISFEGYQPILNKQANLFLECISCLDVMTYHPWIVNKSLIQFIPIYVRWLNGLVKQYEELTLVWSFIDIVFLKTWKCEACTLAMGCVLGILLVERLDILIINMLLVMVKRLSIWCLAILGYDLWLVLWGLWNFVKYACHNYNWDVWWYKVGRIIWRIWLEILRIGRIGCLFRRI
jgi:hypothetical protein